MASAVPPEASQSSVAAAERCEAEAIAYDRFVVTFESDALEETGNESSTDNWKEAA